MWISAILWIGLLALCLVGIIRVGRLLHTDWSPKPIVNLTNLIVIAAGIAIVVRLIIQQFLGSR